MGYWTKYFIDGSNIVGSDEDVNAKRASWSRSNLNNMIGADLMHDGYKIEIFGDGSYWQSETSKVLFARSQGTLVARRIEKQILPTDKFFWVGTTPYSMSVQFNKMPGNALRFYAVNETMYDKWLILEYNVEKRRGSFYLKDHKI